MRNPRENPDLYRFFLSFRKRLAALSPEPWQILAAVSGGCDSVLLLWALAWAASDGAGRLVVGHVNHGLRPEADEEEDFVRSLAAQLGLQFHARHLNVGPQAKRRGWSIEKAARVMRLEALGAIARELGFSEVATGHTMDDQAETVLLRIVRGAGPQGLGGMTPAGRVPSAAGTKIRIIRPLLWVRRSEVRRLAELAELRWREDRSNLDRRFLRNRIRLDLIPLLERQFNPRIVEHLAVLAEWQRSETATSEALARHLFRRILLSEDPARITLAADRLQRLPRPVAGRILLEAFRRLAGRHEALSSRHMTDLYDLLDRAQPKMEPPGRPRRAELHLPLGVTARLEGRRLELRRF